MSSSRVVQAARQRRAGEPVQRPPQNQKYAPRQPANIPPPGPSYTNTSKNYRPPNVPVNEPPQQQQQVPSGKISISDAIALTTIRLAKIENFILQLQENGNPYENISNQMPSFIPENMKMIDEGVFQSIVNRLDLVEKRESTMVTSSLTNNSSQNIQALTDKITTLETDLRNMKDLLLILTTKQEKFAYEIDQKINDNSNKIVKLDSDIAQLDNDINELYNAKNSINAEDSTTLLESIVTEIVEEPVQEIELNISESEELVNP